MKKIIIIIFFSFISILNLHAACGYTVTVAKYNDGPYLGDVRAQATVTITNGSPNYKLYWDGKPGSGLISGNLSAGAHKLVIVDSVNNCLDTFSFSLTDLGSCPYAYIQFNKKDSCKLNDVNLTAQVRDSISFYQGSYVWSNGSTSTALSGISSGTYSVTVSLTSVCTYTSSIVIYDSVCGTTSPCSNFKCTISKIDSCSKNDVTLIANVFNGSGSYSYFWNLGSTASKLYNKTSGRYALAVTDLITQCVTDTAFDIIDDTCGSPCSKIYIAIYEKADSCGLNDVTLATSVYKQNGIGKYKYKWSTGATSEIITKQTSGYYRVTVTDSISGCILDTGFTAKDDTCSPCTNFKVTMEKIDSCGYNDVTLIPVITNGSGSYSYKWNTGATNNRLTKQTTGSFVVTVTDLVKGCVKILTYYVKDSNCNPCNNKPFYLTYYDSCQTNDVTVKCITKQDTINQYTFLWSTGATSKNIYGLTSGKYKVSVSASNGCVYVDSITINDRVFKCCRAYFYKTDDSFFTKKFYSTSTSNSSIIAYNWTFGDGTMGTGTPINHNYTTSGSFTVRHTIETSTGCKDTTYKTVLVPPIGKNLKITHYGSPYVWDTFKKTTINYKNIGSTTEFPIVEYTFPLGCSLISSTPAPTSINGNKLIYNIGQLKYNQSGTIYIKLDVPNTYVMGSYKNDTCKILSFYNDIDTSNNISYNTKAVVASYDPNEKLANPQGEGVDGNIAMNTDEINYLIHFQNDGKWRTYTVRVEDEIDPSLDMSTLDLGDVSHPSRMMINGSKVVWYFDDIELTPSSEDLEKSQGYIAYSLKLKKGLPEKTKIQNTAYIYFDQNPAIVTNTTVHTLKLDAQTNGIYSLVIGKEQIEIIRNQGDLSLTGQLPIEQVEVYSLTGQRILEKSFKTKKADFEISSWPSGIYLFNVKVKNEIHQLKIKL